MAEQNRAKKILGAESKKPKGQLGRAGLMEQGGITYIKTTEHPELNELLCCNGERGSSLRQDQPITRFCWSLATAVI